MKLMKLKCVLRLHSCNVNCVNIALESGHNKYQLLYNLGSFITCNIFLVTLTTID